MDPRACNRTDPPRGWLIGRCAGYIRQDSISVLSQNVKNPKPLRVKSVILTVGCYNRYEHLDGRQKSVEDEKAANPHYGFEDGLRAKVNTLQSGGLSWIYDNNIEEVWKTYTDGRGVVENDQKGIL